MDAILFVAMDGDLDLNNIVQYVMQDLGNEICDNIENRRRNAKPRNENYFEVIIPRYTDVQFIEHFRMSRRTFEVCIFIYVLCIYIQ